jgi:23S rRNA pseudouridine955/2504/2580 synthase
MTLTFQADEDAAGSRLDRYLRRQVEGLTQGVIQKQLRQGKIRVNGKRAEASTHLAAGDVVVMPPLPAPVPGAAPKRQVMRLDAGQIRDLEAMILYRDDDVIAINKPPGLAAQGGTGIGMHLDGMLDALMFGLAERPKLVHRLDRDTSGVMLLARTRAAAAKLSAAFRGRDVEKTYLALLWGVPPEHAGRIDLPLLRIQVPGSSHAEPASREDEDAKRAITEYRILDYAGRKFALAELRPQTGRMHQLRAHCLALGTPIVGDATYGAAFAEPLAPQLHLHAFRLQVPHPAGGLLAVEAKLPPHMRDSLAYLGFTAPEAGRPRRK